MKVAVRQELGITWLTLTLLLFLLLPTPYSRPLPGCYGDNQRTSACQGASRTEWYWFTGYNLTLGQSIPVGNDIASAQQRMDTKQKYGNVKADDGANLRLFNTLLVNAVLTLAGMLGYRMIYRVLSPTSSRGH